MIYKYITETILMNNKHGKSFVIKHSKGCTFMPKMHQNTFGGLRPDPLGELTCSPDSLAAMGGLVLKRGREEEGERACL